MNYRWGTGQSLSAKYVASTRYFSKHFAHTYSFLPHNSAGLFSHLDRKTKNKDSCEDMKHRVYSCLLFRVNSYQPTFAPPCKSSTLPEIIHLISGKSQDANPAGLQKPSSQSSLDPLASKQPGIAPRLFVYNTQILCQIKKGMKLHLSSPFCIGFVPNTQQHSCMNSMF